MVAWAARTAAGETGRSFLMHLWTTKHAVCPLLVAAVAGAALGQTAPCGGEIEQVILDVDADVERVNLSRVRVIDGQAWAVGWTVSATDSLNISYTLEDGQWIPLETPSVADTIGRFRNSLYNLDGSSASNIWAVGRHTGQTSSSDTLALHWDGNEWEHVPTPGESMFGAQGFWFEGVYVPDEDTAWFVGFAALCVRGEGYIVRRNADGSFDEFCVGIPTNAAASYRDVDGVGPDDIWAVGGRGGVAVAVGRAIAAHWDGSSWTPNNPPEVNFGEVLEAVVMVGPDDVWASGRYDRIVDNVARDTPLFWHWDGAGWTRHESPGFARDLVALSSDDIYGVSGDNIVHWNGVEWSLLPQEFDPAGSDFIAMSGVAAFGPCDLVFAGETLFPYRPAFARLQDSAGCVADFSGDGTLNFADIAAFLDAFNAGDPAADLDGDGNLSFFDVSDFIAAFLAGCP
tara:strand:- start:498 stop:1868 length:1371 start_codon:yes stop_codon:yes gene_type:complete